MMSTGSRISSDAPASGARTPTLPNKRNSTMATLETIRLLRIRAVAEGLEKAAQDNAKLADAMREVAKAADLQADKTDKSANKTLNGLKAWEAYQRTTDNVFRAVER